MNQLTPKTHGMPGGTVFDRQGGSGEDFDTRGDPDRESGRQDGPGRQDAPGPAREETVMRSEVDYTGQPSMIAAARHFTADFLTEAARRGVKTAARQYEAALLVVSELVTNAVRHAPGPCRLALSVSDRTLEIAVTDSSEGQPAAEPREPERVGRHGLEIVLALCHSVDLLPLPQGKTVRARLATT